MMLFLERLLVLAAERHHVAHVDLVEGRELGGDVLRFLEAKRHCALEPRHWHALLAIGARASSGRRHFGRRGRAFRRSRFKRRQHVALGNAAVFAGSGDICGTQSRFFRKSPYRRHQRIGSCCLRCFAGCRLRRFLFLPRARRGGEGPL